MSDILLAVDCSLRYTGIAVATESDGEMKILSELNADIGFKQAKELPVLAENVIRDSGAGLRDITHVAVTNGPGYFTGVRVGMSWSAAFAYGIGANIVPVGTLEALISSGDGVTPSIYLIYAGRNSAYAASSGFPVDLEVNEYELDYISEWAGVHRDINFRALLDNPEKITLPNLNAQKFTPQISNVAKTGWNKRAYNSLSPFKLRANWCRSPV